MLNALRFVWIFHELAPNPFSLFRFFSPHTNRIAPPMIFRGKRIIKNMCRVAARLNKKELSNLFILRARDDDV